MQTRRPRLSVIQDAALAGTQKFKDHITGEVLSAYKIQERVSAGEYSAYHVHHLNLARLHQGCRAN